MTPIHRAPFLAASNVIDWHTASVRDLAGQLTSGARGTDAIARLFTWVRDSIAHTGDVGHGPLTLRASDVLRERTGLCYAKSHLLVALLRASNIPAGFCYQRLSLDETASSFVLHGLASVLMPDDTFLRIDPRGNKPGVDAQLTPGREALAFALSLPGEADLPGVFAEPIPQVIEALSAATHWHPTDVALPDVHPERWANAAADWRRFGHI